MPAVCSRVQDCKAAICCQVLYACAIPFYRCRARAGRLRNTLLAEALTGERPPYATLVYVWDATAPVGTVIINPRSDRIRKIVVDSGDRKSVV